MTLLEIKQALLNNVQMSVEDQPAHELHAKINKLRLLPIIRVGLLFYDNIDIASSLGGFGGDRIQYVEAQSLDDPALNICDIILLHSPHTVGPDREAVIRRLLTLRRNSLVGLWLWDHHHMFEHSAILCQAADLVFATHADSVEYLYQYTEMVFSVLPAASYQWGNRQQLEALSAHVTDTKRRDNLYGSFRQYHGMRRNTLLERYQSVLPDSDLVNMPEGLPASEHPYYSKSKEQQFIEWCSYKVSVSSSISYDIPIRVFDALVSGQIPLVPVDNTAAWNFFRDYPAKKKSNNLPVVPYIARSSEDFTRAYNTALEQFNDEGINGALARHEYALSHHLLEHRIKDMMMMIQTFVHWPDFKMSF